MQIKEEILELLKILEKFKPKTILEIGTFNGGTLFLFSRIADSNAIIVSVDLPGGKFGGVIQYGKFLYTSHLLKINKEYT
jgi:cephalosporin hydroxylase